MKSNLRIALDLDDTIFIWRQSHEEYFHCKISKCDPKKITLQVNSLKDNEEFWSNLPLLERPDFIPELYCTKRVNSAKFTVNCLDKYKLPIRPIVQFYNQSDNKADGLVGVADVLIDDSWYNVQQCLEAGFPALLITRPHNKWVKTKYRVSHLNYNEIEQKYHELF